MIATIAVMAAIAERKKNFSDCSDHMKPLPSDRSKRQQSLRYIKSSISGIVITAIAGECFHMITELFFLSDRSDHMETGLNLSQ